MLTLTVIQGPDKGRRFQLPEDQPQLIGRSSEALPVTDIAISRRHAELTPDNGSWWIRDLASQNGTYINGRRIRDRTRLESGDQVRVGSSVLLFGSPRPQRPEVVRLLESDELDTEIEETLAGSFGPGDSIILAEPAPAAAEHLRVIYELTSLTTRTMDRHELLGEVLDLVFAQFRPERGFIVLLEEADGDIIQPTVVKYRAPAGEKGAPMHVSRTILQHVLRRAEGVLSANAMTDARFAAGDSIQQFAIRSAICSPIVFRKRMHGAIYIDSSIANYSFTREQLALMNAVGRHTGLALANADLRAEALQAERLAAVGETVASLSHSIKNILQGMRGGADLVEMALERDDSKGAKNGWGILKRNLDRIVSLSMNMLAFSRQRPVEIEFMQLGPLVDDCVQLMEIAAASKGVSIKTAVDPEMPPVPIDASLVHQALMNLVANAIEAAPGEGGEVTIGAEYLPAQSRGEGAPPVCEISVADNGPGVDEQMRARIFEPFSTTKGTRGTGLGLAVTKRIIEEHGGRVGLESGSGAAPGRGAIFTITLPADLGRVRDPADTATDAPDFTDV